MNDKKKYSSSINYVDRKTKSEYIFEKYQSLFKSSVLDVGADAMYLKPKIIQCGARYTGMGFGEGIDLEYDLEKVPLPFVDNEFETVMCFDVLEHLECIHIMFDELCRISSDYIIISLPNPWADFFHVLRKGDYSKNESIKFYGLPVDKPKDRHRWFFSEADAKKFIEERAKRNGWKVEQCDVIRAHEKMGGDGLKGALGRILLRKIFRSDIDLLGLHHMNIWFVLKKIK